MTQSIEVQTLEVDRDEFSNTRIHRESLDLNLQADEVLLKVDRFALTANNITYCMVGDLLGYWQFFPTEQGWGRVPVMAYGEVLDSAHSAIQVGERVWGFFPMSTHLKVLAGKVQTGVFTDVSPHRADLAPVYSQFQRASANPIYQVEREDQDSLLRGLFLTSWLCEDFMTDNNTFGAQAYLITSASSKTSIALAYAVKQRGEKQTLGITSAGNMDFCRSLGCYDKVVEYKDLHNLDASVAAVLVDMAGNADVTSRLHHHYAEKMRYSCMIGGTHQEAMGSADNLPGATPEFFFAPTQAQKRAAQWGPIEMEKRVANSFVGFREFCDGWLEISRSYGPDAISKSFAATLAGGVSPSEGCILSMWDNPEA